MDGAYDGCGEQATKTVDRGRCTASPTIFGLYYLTTVIQYKDCKEKLQLCL